MFIHIMVSVDPVHKGKLHKALDVAGDVAVHRAAKVHVVTI